MFHKSLLIPIGIIASLYSAMGEAHIEHDKARYVADNGIDKGYCDKPFRPCKTISYAVQQASKGDKVLVASGHYKLENESDLFYLQSQLVPVKAGFNRMDHFQLQSPTNNPTFISNAPISMHDTLYKAGFTVINDGKSNLNSAEIQAKLAKVKILSEVQTEQDCVNGIAGGFSCNNVDLVAHVPLTSFSGKPSSGSDIWGHVDLNTQKEYALMAHRNGVTVFDLSNPSQPAEVGVVTGVNTSWRDVKVYQYFDTALHSYQAYAYVTAESSDGIVIIDLNNLPHSVTKVNQLNDDESKIHNVYISNIDYTYNLSLPGSKSNVLMVGGSQTGGAFRSYSLKDPINIPIDFKNSGASRSDYTHDAASALIKDNRASRDCEESSGKCTVLVDFNETEMHIWNISKSTEPKLLSSTSYSEVSNSNKYVHSGWFSEDNKYVFLHDEFDETRGGLNTTVRVFDIQDLTQPSLVASWKSNNQTIDHNGFTRGNRYYMSNYERGLTILDISDPTNPSEVGYFDTFPSSNHSSYNGAWGVYPFLPSGLILISDINSGLYVLKDRTKELASDRLSFSNASIELDQAGQIQIPVTRSGNTNLAASIDFESLNGSAKNNAEFELEDNTLNWSAGESDTKFITLNITQDFSQSQPAKEFFIRLINPQSGSAIGDHGYIRINLAGTSQSGTISFGNTPTKIAENQNSVTVNVNRTGGSEGRLDVSYQLADNTNINQDVTLEQTTLTWLDGETDVKSFTINLIDDNESEQDETIEIVFTATNEMSQIHTSTLEITLLDDENNQAPIVDLADGAQIPTRSELNLVITTATDPEGDDMTYLWEQISGPAVDFSGSNLSLVSISSGDDEGDAVLKLTVTDQRGASSSDTITFKVVEPPAVVTEDNNSSSGSMIWILLAMIGLITRRKI